jgi:RNA polymerase sigma-70 factor (ECF subfamily)
MLYVRHHPSGSMLPSQTSTLGNPCGARGHNQSVKDFSALPDEELWSAAASHDVNAFGELFERHADTVYNHCFRRTGSWSVAEDLTSVVFLETWRRRKQVQFSHL